MAETIWNWRTVGLIVGFYTLLSMFFVPRLLFANEIKHELNMLLLFSVGNYMWAGLSLFVFYLGERFPVAYPANYRNLGFHLLFALAIASVFAPVYGLFVNFYNFGVVSLTLYQPAASFFINIVTNSFMYYTGSLAAHQAVFYSKKFRERESQLQQAELEILKMQIHPHFFFNTLNAISALMYSSPKEADKMIIQLGDMFRIALKQNKAQEIVLGDELKFLKAFLHIHQTLMNERLTVDWQIEPETLNALVPNLIMQPLAENAIKHGIAPLEEGGRITISSARRNGNLILTLSDDGLGFGMDHDKRSGGIGLVNTRARLQNLYGDSHTFAVDPRPAGGVTAKIEIPFRTTVVKNDES